MPALATQTTRVNPPWDADAFLKRRAERRNTPAPNTIGSIIIGTVGDATVEDEANDPFYSESNMRVLRESIAEAERGEFAVKMTFEELVAITNEALAKLK